MQVFKPHLRPTDSEILGLGPKICASSSTPGMPGTLKVWEQFPYTGIRSHHIRELGFPKVIWSGLTRKGEE